ncbi:MAG: 2OG-Fe(II) oxygenase [Acidithiobacillus sp.]|nr:2OG-Fe(II) oxygenase [Acidithiobacillus sp.]
MKHLDRFSEARMEPGELSREAIGSLIAHRLTQEKETAAKFWRATPAIPYVVFDDLLPEDLARNIYEVFPGSEQMILRNSIKERKFVGVAMASYHPLIAEVTFAFQVSQVVSLIQEITGLKDLSPDPTLYAAGVSLMGQGHFLNPHLDNSHDETRQRFRALNLLYYVTPGWREDYGGNLELWENGPDVGIPTTLVSRFNRLVITGTHKRSWHSVNMVRVAGNRCCISNYYFASEPIDGNRTFHVTTFRGRPEQKGRDIVIRADNAIRSLVRKGIKRQTTFHVFRPE